MKFICWCLVIVAAVSSVAYAAGLVLTELGNIAPHL